MESNYLKAARCKSVNKIPIWMMRQAGRYMESFRNLRKKYGFLELVRTPELAAEVTMQPIDAFHFDAAIIFSDILVLADALGCGFTYIDNVGPKIEKRILNMHDLNQLTVNGIEANLHYVFEAIRLAKQRLRPKGIPLIGFSGAPFTLASYMMGEAGKGDMKKSMNWYFQNIEFVERTLEVLTEASIRYLRGQILAGADSIQIFESWNDVLPHSLVEKFSIRHIKKITDALTAEFDIPIAIFGTANSVFYPLLGKAGVNIISFDSKIDLIQARQSLPSNIAIQGNLDSNFLFSPKKILLEEVHRILDSMKGRQGFIFNLGHGVLQHTPEENVQLVVDCVHSYK